MDVKIQDVLTFPSLLILKSGVYNLHARVCQKSFSNNGVQISCGPSQTVALNLNIKYLSTDISRKYQKYRRSLQALFHFSQDLYTYIQQVQKNILAQNSRVKNKDIPSLALINNLEDWVSQE